MKKPELLAPAGDFEKLEIAVHYGADAVYLAGKNFSLRNFSGNFSQKELCQAVQFARKNDVKTYVACNIYSRTSEQKAIEDFLHELADIQPDAIIISDPGIILMARTIIPDIDIHLSTQANTTNLSAATFWHKQGVKRVNLARELSLDEISKITENSQIETEVFIHGAMCVSYSGRCLLSMYLSGRDSNRGLCSHPCRWKYAVVEELRPGEFHPVMEDERGTYIFNSKDLCMIRHIPDLVKAGITSLKIEGRMKGVHYLASVVKTYREAIDTFFENPDNYQFNSDWEKELGTVFHREFSTGFFVKDDSQQKANWENRHTGQIHSFIGKVIKTSGKRCTLEVRNKLVQGDWIELLSPDSRPVRIRANTLIDETGKQVGQANPNTIITLDLDTICQTNDIVRKI